MPRPETSRMDQAVLPAPRSKARSRSCSAGPRPSKKASHWRLPPVCARPEPRASHAAETRWLPRKRRRRRRRGQPRPGLDGLERGQAQCQGVDEKLPPVGVGIMERPFHGSCVAAFEGGAEVGHLLVTTPGVLRHLVAAPYGGTGGGPALSRLNIVEVSGPRPPRTRRAGEWRDRAISLLIGFRSAPW